MSGGLRGMQRRMQDAAGCGDAGGTGYRPRWSAAAVIADENKAEAGLGLRAQRRRGRAALDRGAEGGQGLGLGLGGGGLDGAGNLAAAAAAAGGRGPGGHLSMVGPANMVLRIWQWDENLPPVRYFRYRWARAGHGRGGGRGRGVWLHGIMGCQTRR